MRELLKVGSWKDENAPEQIWEYQKHKDKIVYLFGGHIQNNWKV